MSLIIEKAASVSDGTIKKLSEAQQKEAIGAAETFIGSLCKFTPASGAATRMFKPLFEEGAQAEQLRIKLKKLTPIDFSLEKEKLASTPKGLLPFHRYADFVRTPFEEHLVEGAKYAKNNAGEVNLYFTVSEEHLSEFRQLADATIPKYEKLLECRYRVHFSVQDPSTDVTAYDADGKPFVKEDGSILKRPAGHGALLGNLQQCTEDFIFIKNIDNVVKETHLADTVTWKKILLGRAVILRNKIEHALEIVKSNQPIGDVLDMLRSEFGIAFEPTVSREEIYTKLNRPLRVCGMVVNEGEPGGGPFVCKEPDSTTSNQILESVQIEDKSLMKTATHFNPVDIVCCIKNSEGEVFHLQNFVDSSTGLSVEKTFGSRKARYTELPGLWNGSMSRWNTQFVEVPLSTFNPVKTVADLLRPAHQ